MIFNRQCDKRLIIYFFFDEDGVVDSYVEYMLKSLECFSDEFLIVCNGKLNEHGKALFEKYGTVIIRENVGYDVWAYKTGLEYLGWEELERYSEIILMNSTIMGPIYSWKDTFEKMDSQSLDFWGITKSFKTKENFINSEYGYIPEHIQSHFIACRKTLIRDQKFQDYWNDMPIIKKYEDSIRKHEIIFTKYFEELGFKWNVSVDEESLREYADTPLLMCPFQMLKEKGCPIFKRRSFFQNSDSYMQLSGGEVVSRLMNFIEYNTSYPIDLIWDTILRKYHQSDIVKNMNLYYILSKDSMKCVSDNPQIGSVALIAHIFFEDLLDETFDYIFSMPKFADIYISTDTFDKQKKIQSYLEKSQFIYYEVRVIPNRGRDVGSLLVGMKDIVDKYDLICFVHDKKVGQIFPKSIGLSFAYKCFENVLGSQEYVTNIIRLFEENPRLGLASPPEPNHGIYFQCIGGEWGNNYDTVKKLKQALNLNVPMDISKQPIAPFGTMFWFRPKSLKKLFDKDWKYEDFPQEPNAVDGTILHAIERIYPFVVQDAGFYPSVIMNSEYAAIEYGNLRYDVRKYNQILIEKGQGGNLAYMVGYVEKKLNTVFGVNIKSVAAKTKRIVKNTVKKFLPHILYEKLLERIRE